MENKTVLYGKDAIDAAIRKGNVNIAGTMKMEVLELNAESKEAQLLHAENLRKFEAKKKARSIMVPTSAEEIKLKLRELGHPITLFGEGPADRRERLREVIAALELSDEELKRVQESINQKSVSSTTMGITTISQETTKLSTKEVFYSPALEEMIIMRKYLCEYSITRAQNRIINTKRLRDDDQLTLQENQKISFLYKNSRQIILNSSQYGDDRPMSCIRYSPYENILAAGSLNTTVKLWNCPNLDCLETLRGHKDRITSIAWHPQAFHESTTSMINTMNHTERIGYIATTSAGNTCQLYKCTLRVHDSNSDSENNSSSNHMYLENDDNNHSYTHSNNNSNYTTDKESITNNNSSNHQKQIISSEHIYTLFGHQSSINSCEFHPSGRLLGTASYDYTWRLWDLETSKEILLQDGHSKECSTISFQIDGSIVCTSDYAGVVLIWDLRSGQQIQAFQGHVKKITSSCFHPNGFQVYTSGIDNTVRIWDLRKRKCSYILPAHNNIISDLKLSRNGELLITSSFDHSIKIWGTRDYRLLNTLQGHVGKVMSCDFCPKEETIVSAGFDRTIKYWTHKDIY